MTAPAITVTTRPRRALDPFERAGVTELTEGQRGPALRLAPIPRRRRRPPRAFADKLVVLNFWATWCTPCTAEMPTLEGLWQEYRGRGLVVIGVSVDRGAPRAVLEPYIRSITASPSRSCSTPTAAPPARGA